MEPIVGLAALASQYGSPEVGAAEGHLQASQLPRGFVGIPTTLVEPGESVEIQVDVQRDMRPDRLILSDALTGAVPPSDLMQVEDIRVGTVSLNASRNPVPANVFSAQSVGTSIRATMTATPSIGIQLFVRNDGSSGGEFPDPDWQLRGMFIGPTAEAGSAAEGQVGAIVGSSQDSADETPASSNDARQLPQSFVGVPRTTFTAQQQRYVQVDIQRDIRPDRLILSAFCFAEYLIRDIRVSTVSLNASMNPATGHGFAPLVFGARLRAQVTATPNVGISLTVQADSWDSGGAPRAPLMPFFGAIFGPSRRYA